MKKKKKQEIVDEFVFDDDPEIKPVIKQEQVNKTPIKDGQRTLKDIVAPSGILIPEIDRMVVGNKHVRNYILQGYPKSLWVRWLDEIYNYDGNMDTQVLILPADDRRAIDELTANITKYEAQLQVETKNGNITNITALQAKVSELYRERMKLEQNFESLYHVNVTSNLLCDSEAELNKQSQILESTLKGKRMSFIPSYLNMDNGYKSTLPFAKDFMGDKLRNLNSGAVTAMFPFYNSEINDIDGTFIGFNGSTGLPLYMKLMDREKKINSNMLIIGKSGSGKTYLTSLLIMRSLLKMIHVAIVDPEGDYRGFVDELGGLTLKISPDSDFKINVCDIEDEDELDADGNKTGRRIVDINSKIVDLMSLFAVMVGDKQNGLTKVQDSIISTALKDMYHRFGITSDPNSLYENGDSFDIETGQLYATGRKKVMPTISDCQKILKEYSLDPENKEIIPVVKAMDMFVKGGVFGMFDCQSSHQPEELLNSPLISFDVSALEEDIMRPIGMYIAMSWIWDKFVKKQSLDVMKMVVCDEAWMLTSKSIRGHEYTGAFLERCARRIRKRHGGLAVASQHFREFNDSEHGKAVLNNTAYRFFMKPSETDIDEIQEKFKLSDGEREYLLTATTGNALIRRDNGDSAIVRVYAFAYEDALIKSKNH